MAQSNLEEFIRNLRVPVQRDENLLTWKEEDCRFTVEVQQTHLVMSIEQPAPEAECERQLLFLYQRAAPQRFMGLPLRVYRQNASMTGTLALPWQAAVSGNLMNLRDALRRLFESAALSAA